VSVTLWLRRPWMWVVIALVVGASTVAVLGLAPFFRVQHVDVSGNSQVSSDDVLGAAEVSQGRPLLTAPLDEIASRIETLDAVASASVTRDWPNRLQIVVKERRPVGYALSDDGVLLVGSDGVIYRVQANPPSDVPLLPASVSGVGETYPGSSDDAAAEAFEVAAGLPRALRRAIESVEATGPRAVQLVFSDGVVVEWGSAAEAAQKEAVVMAMREQRQWGRSFTVVDVSVPEAPALR